MQLWEVITAIIFILIGIGLFAYAVLKLKKESKTPSQPKVYCGSCGAANSPKATFCVKCGKKLGASQQQS